MKAILRTLLKKLGLLNWIRKIRYKNQHRSHINQFKGQSHYDLHYKNIDLKFSLADPFSAIFFSYHFKNGVYEVEGLDAMLESVGENSIVLDSFAGSGTTAHAVLNLNKQDGGNRKFILIEMEDYAETITAERVKRVINGYGTTEATKGATRGSDKTRRRDSF